MRAVDPPDLLNAALERSRLSAADLAARGGTSPAAVSHYLAGRRSPTVRTLNRLLAGVGLQMRVTLEPLLAHVDERVDAMEAGTPLVQIDALRQVSESFATDHGHGPVRWAVDGATALNLHGLAVPHAWPTVVVELDDALRTWLFRGLMRSTTPVDDTGTWLSWNLEEVQESMRGLVLGRSGMLMMRAAAVLPPVVQLRPEGSDRDFPVVSVDEVERTRPELAEVLQRWRERRVARERATP